MKHWMFSCRDVTQKASQAMDVSLPLRQRMAIRIHLLMCRYCARLLRQWTALRKAGRAEDMDLPTKTIPEKLSEEAKTRIKEKLRALG